MLSANPCHGFWYLLCVFCSLPEPNVGFGTSLLTCLRHYFARSTHTLHYLASFFSLFCPNWSHWGAPRAQNSIKDDCFSTFFDTAKIAPRLSKATLGPPKKDPQGGHFFCKGPMWAFGGRLISFFAPLLRRFWAQEGANGSLGGEQRPPLLKQATSGQRKKLNFTLEKH